MSTCECGHPKHGHRILCPTATERTTTMTDKTPPYVIDASEARVGDVLELSDYSHDPNQRIIGTLSKFDAVGGWLIHEAPKITLLDRPEPPKPELPTEPGTVIRCTLDAERTGRSTATMIRDGFGGWRGPDLSGDSRDVTESESDRITDWVVVYDPTAPQADDGLRERVEKLAEDFESQPDAASTGHYIAHHLRAALTETSADA